MSARLEALARDILARAEGRDSTYVFAIAGPPGAGKSTLAEALLARLEALAPETAALLPMDGFHFDNAVLAARGLMAHKGAPETFDVAGLDRTLAAIVAGEAVAVPVFDRGLDLARAGARLLGAGQPVVLVEGNYLLLDAAPWDGLAVRFDRTLMIEVAEAELRRRLVARWRFHGLTEAEAVRRAEENDMANARCVAAGSRPADLTWPGSGP